MSVSGDRYQYKRSLKNGIIFLGNHCIFGNSLI